MKFKFVLHILVLSCFMHQAFAQDSLKTQILKTKISVDTNKVIILNVNGQKDENKIYYVFEEKIDLQVILDWIQIISFMGFVLGIYQIFLVKKQIIEAQKTNSGMIYLRLHDFWKSVDIYEAASYIHSLRQEWKKDELGIENWEEITKIRAKNWVINNYPVNNKNKDAKENWSKRRLLAQFFHQMVLMIEANFISKNDFFSMVPEAKRLLCVLIPIEHAIYMSLENSDTKEVKIDGWDFTASKKLELLDEYFDDWIKNDAPIYYEKTIINLERELNKKR